MKFLKYKDKSCPLECWLRWGPTVFFIVKEKYHKTFLKINSWPYVTFNDFWVLASFYRKFGFVSVHRNLHQNCFINESAEKNLSKIQESHSYVVF